MHSRDSRKNHYRLVLARPLVDSPPARDDETVFAHHEVIAHIHGSIAMRLARTSAARVPHRAVRAVVDHNQLRLNGNQ